MKFLDLLRMSSSSLWKRKVRTILTVLGVVIGTASIVVMVSLGLGLNKATMAEIESYGGLTTINVYEGGGGGGGYYSIGIASAAGSDSSQGETKRLDDKALEEIAGLPYVEFVSPVLTTNVLAKYGAYEANLTIQGMSVEALEKMDIPIGQGSLPKEGEPLKFFYGNMVIQDFYNAKTGEYFWGTDQVADIDLMNDSIFIIFDMDAYYQSQYNDGETVVAPPKKYMIESSGIVAGGLQDYNNYCWGVYCDVEALKDQLKRIFKNKAIPGQPTTKTGKPYKDLYYNSIYVSVSDMERVKEVQTAITNMGYQANSNIEWVESMQKQYANVQAVLGGIGAVSLLVAAIGITNTMMMSIYERTKEIGVMKVLGCDMRNIQFMFLMEAGFIGFIGGVVGLGLSCSISALINQLVAQSGNSSFSSYIPIWLALLSIAFAVVVGMVAGFFPSLRAMRLSPLAAIRNE